MGLDLRQLTLSLPTITVCWDGNNACQTLHKLPASVQKDAADPSPCQICLEWHHKSALEPECLAFCTQDIMLPTDRQGQQQSKWSL